jgi:hypothetical protein
MPLYLLCRNDIRSEYYGNWTRVNKIVCGRDKVVRADNPTEARYLANECIYANGSQGISKPNCDPVWNDPEIVSCQELEPEPAKGILLLR